MLSKQSLLECDLINLATTAAFLSKVKHPSLLSVYGICLEPNKTCLVVEYMPKGSLSTVLRGKTAPHFGQMIEIAKSIVLGMEYLSNFPDPSMYLKHVFKSHNILVSQNWEVKISDFGQVCVKDLAPTMSSLTNVACTAPEILDGSDPHPKSAVYSFGMILWELYTRKVPLEEENPLKASNKILQGYRPPIPDDCPPLLHELLEACWSAKPEQRPAWPAITEQLDHLLARYQKSKMK